MDKHKVLEIRVLTDSTYVLRFERNGLEFIPGQHIYVGIPGDEDRPYSVYSAEDADYVEILVKEVENGNVSKKLKQIETDGYVAVDDAQGHFSIIEYLSYKMYFIATGTGIAPFHSFVKTYPGIDYTLIHGVAFANEGYEKSDYEPSRYIQCTSKENGGDFSGRVTEYLKTLNFDPESRFFLCGNSAMIDEVYDILLERGFARNRIRTEIYF